MLAQQQAGAIGTQKVGSTGATTVGTAATAGIERQMTPSSGVKKRQKPSPQQNMASLHLQQIAESVGVDDSIIFIIHF
jgi:hypothetical protein